MGTAEVDSTKSTVNADSSHPVKKFDTPVAERISHIVAGSAFKRRIMPRPTLAKPRTTLLLPRTGAEWLKTIASTVGALAVVSSTLIGARYVAETGCEEFGVDRQSVFSSQGLTVNVRPDMLVGAFGVKVSGVAPTAPDAQTALAALPKSLTPRSAFVALKTCNIPPRGMTLRMQAPAGEAELNKLDLYGWDEHNRVWNWVGGEVDRSTREIVGHVTRAPAALVLVKTSQTKPVLSIEVSPKASSSGGPESSLSTVIAEVSASGLYLGDFGGLAGDPTRLQTPQGAKVVPVIRNWSDKGEYNRRLLRDMLLRDSSIDTHVLNLVTLVEANRFKGLEVDYRGLDLKQSERYTLFIEKLARALQAKDKTLTVAIPAPINVSDKWDVGGYDIAAIGRAANYVKLDLSANPSALTSSQLDSQMNWSFGQVNRYKLQIVLPALSIRQDAYGRTRLISLSDALAPLGALEPEQEKVQPGSRVRLNWKGNATAIKFDEASQTYRYTYVDAKGIQQTVWVNTSASLKRLLERLSVYNVRGITLRGLDLYSDSEDVVQIVNDFAARKLAQAPSHTPELVVAVSGAVATNRLDSVIEIQAPNEPGDYPIVPTFKTSRAFGMQARALSVSKDAPPIVPTATPVTPANANQVFELGGHAGSLDHVAQMKSSGMSWIRGTVEGFDFPGEFIQSAKLNGLNVVIEAVGDRSRVLDPVYQAEWSRHLAKLAASGVDAIEVWDEPNYEGSWPAGNIDGARYTELLKQAYTAIKAANPKTLVISGGLVASDVFAGGCSNSGCDDVRFLTQMAEAGAQNYMDCVGAHFTNSFSAPGATGGASTYNYRSLFFAPMRDLYFNAFGGSKPVCFTELGFVTAEGFTAALPRAYSWATGTTLAQHAQWLAESVKLSKESGKVRLLLVWNIDSDFWSQDDPQAGFAMIRPDGSCPACETLRGVMTSQ